MTDIAAWLAKQGLGQFAMTFADHDIDFEVLTELSDQDLRELGLTLGQRRKLLKAIAAHRRGCPQIPATAPERRQLTVMFVDLVGSTKLSTRFDPEDLRELIVVYQNTVAKEISRFEGHVAKYMGDGVLAYFGWPQAHEHDAERSVRAALAVNAAVAKLYTRDNTPLAAHIGIATGLVVVGDLIGEGAAQEAAVVGEAPILAARLQALAEPNTTLISAATRHLTGGMFDYADLGFHRLKGFEEPVQVWRVVAESQVESRFLASHGVATRLSPLVGRSGEMRLLQQCWQQTQNGQGRAILLTGEAGIGKSRLIETLRRQMKLPAQAILGYFCSPYHQHSAFYPIVQQIERAALFGGEDAAELKLEKLQNLLLPTDDQRQTLRVFAALLSIPGGDRYPALDLSPRRLKAVKLQALCDQLVALTGRQAVLMIVEDLHWIDPTTLEWLEWVIERVTDLRLLVVMTARPEFVSPWHKRVGVRVVGLERLDTKSSTEIVRQLCANKPLPDELMAQLIGKTDGIPLFIEELTKMVLESGILQDRGECYTLTGPLPPLAIPSTVHDFLVARFDRLARVREIAQVGAVIGRRFSYALIAAVARRSDEELDKALDRLVDAALVVCRGTPPHARYTFKHVLLQEAAYNSLLNEKRQRLHADIVNVLEQQFAATVATQPELLAYHCVGAKCYPKAIAYWHKASQHAIQNSAYIEALAHLDKGLALIANLASGREQDRLELALQTARAVVYQATRGFSSPVTGSIYERARQLCDRLDDATAVFPTLHGIYLFHSLRAELDLSYEVAGECLQRAQHQRDSLLLTIAHRVMGAVLLTLGDFVAARGHIEQVLTQYDPEAHRQAVYTYGADPKAIALAHGAQVWLALGYPDQSQTLAGQAIAHSEMLGHGYNLGYVLFWYNTVGIERGDNAAAVCETALRLQALGAEQGFPTWEVFGTFQHGAALAQQGELERGITQMRQGLDEYLTLEIDLFRPNKLAALALALAQSGEIGQALEQVSDALALVRRTKERWYEAELHRIRGELLLSHDTPGNIEAAETSLRQALAVACQQQAKFWQLRAAYTLALLWRDRNRRESARQLITPIYQWFKEGHKSPDLHRAATLVAELTTH